MYLNQEATGIEELLIYLESEIFEEGMPSFQRQKIWEFHEVGKCWDLRTIMIIIVKTKHESWEEGRVELKPLSAEAEDIRVSSDDPL